MDVSTFPGDVFGVTQTALNQVFSLELSRFEEAGAALSMTAESLWKQHRHVCSRAQCTILDMRCRVFAESMHVAICLDGDSLCLHADGEGHGGKYWEWDAWACLDTGLCHVCELRDGGCDSGAFSTSQRGEELLCPISGRVVGRELLPAWDVDPVKAAKFRDTFAGGGSGVLREREERAAAYAVDVFDYWSEASDYGGDGAMSSASSLLGGGEGGMDGFVDEEVLRSSIARDDELLNSVPAAVADTRCAGIHFVPVAIDWGYGKTQGCNLIMGTRNMGDENPFKFRVFPFHPFVESYDALLRDALHVVYFLLYSPRRVKVSTREFENRCRRQELFVARKRRAMGGSQNTVSAKSLFVLEACREVDAAFDEPCPRAPAVFGEGGLSMTEFWTGWMGVRREFPQPLLAFDIDTEKRQCIGYAQQCVRTYAELLSCTVDARKLLRHHFSHVCAALLHMRMCNYSLPTSGEHLWSGDPFLRRQLPRMDALSDMVTSLGDSFRSGIITTARTTLNSLLNGAQHRSFDFNCRPTLSEERMWLYNLATDWVHRHRAFLSDDDDATVYGAETASVTSSSVHVGD